MTQPAQLCDFVQIPRGGAPVLDNVAHGRSPWHGFDAGPAMCRNESADAYGERARIITACRDRGLLDDLNLLTEAGRRAHQAWESRLG